jgi:ArsR family transcriptional regulator, lead/cadmium/zinc/bismuth-responsive transcriptional repressor
MSAYPYDHTDMRKNDIAENTAVDPTAVAKAREQVLSAEDAARLTGLLSLLADPVRVRMLDALETVNELCVGDLALALDVNEDAASYGLRLLRTAGLVQARKDGRTVVYRLAERFPEPLLEHCLRELLHLSRVAAELDDPPARSRTIRKR